jgi:hypothetical protein
MKPDEYVIERNVAKYMGSKQPIKIKMIEQLIGFYGYKSTIDAKISKSELQALSLISKKYVIPSR